MATATIPQSPPSAGCVTLRDVGREFYGRFLEATSEQRVRHAYRDGHLTLMSRGGRDERRRKQLSQMVNVVTEEFEIPRLSVGSLTLTSAAQQVGAEPDEAYYVAHEQMMRDKPEFDPETDPPPDLVIEVDVTSPSLKRLDIYAAIGVPEVWVYDGESLRVHLLSKRSAYRESKKSGAFPFLPMPEFAAWLEKAHETDETTWIRAFRAWVSERWGARQP